MEQERLGEGAFFGERALINAEPRDVSASGTQRPSTRQSCCQPALHGYAAIMPKVTSYAASCPTLLAPLAA